MTQFLNKFTMEIDKEPQFVGWIYEFECGTKLDIYVPKPRTEIDFNVFMFAFNFSEPWEPNLPKSQ